MLRGRCTGILMSTWYVLVDNSHRYLPLLSGKRPWVVHLSHAEVFTSLQQAKQAVMRYSKTNPGCRIERIPRLPDRPGGRAGTK